MAFYDFTHILVNVCVLNLLDMNTAMSVMIDDLDSLYWANRKATDRSNIRCSKEKSSSLSLKLLYSSFFLVTLQVIGSFLGTLYRKNIKTKRMFGL